MTIQTEQNNLAVWDSKLRHVVGEQNFFVHDLTERLSALASKSGIQNGHLIAQVLHTTCVIGINELDEPMLLGDLCRQLENQVPNVSDCLHNSSMRTVNLCEDNHKCDRNADAHLKAFLTGHHSVTLLIRDGGLVMGQW